MSNRTDFLKKLQQEAKLQAKLEQKKILPKQIDIVSIFIATHPWQIISGLAFLTALLIEIMNV